MKVYVKYDKDGYIIGMGDTVRQLAEDVGVAKSVIYRALRHGSKTYAVVEIEEGEEDDCESED